MGWGKKKKTTKTVTMDAQAAAALASDGSGLGFLDGEEFGGATEQPEYQEQAAYAEEQYHAEQQAYATPMVSIGPSLEITGELTGNEDIIIDGVVDGRVSVNDHTVTVGEHGHIKAEIHASSVVVAGEVVGNIVADDKVEVTATGALQGDITAPRVVLAEGARFEGKVDMGPRPATETPQETEPELESMASGDSTIQDLDDAFGSFDLAEEVGEKS